MTTNYFTFDEWVSCYNKQKLIQNVSLKASKFELNNATENLLKNKSGLETSF